MTSRHAVAFNRISVVSLIGLLIFCLLWEIWLAPLHPGGSTLALKALPLLLPLFGLLHGKRYTHQWTSMLCLLYMAEGLVRMGSDPVGQRWAPLLEVVLAVALFGGCVGYAKATAENKVKAED